MSKRMRPVSPDRSPKLRRVLRGVPRYDTIEDMYNGEGDGKEGERAVLKTAGEARDVYIRCAKVPRDKEKFSKWAMQQQWRHVHEAGDWIRHENGSTVDAAWLHAAHAAARTARNSSWPALVEYVNHGSQNRSLIRQGFDLLLQTVVLHTKGFMHKHRGVPFEDSTAVASSPCSPVGVAAATRTRSSRALAHTHVIAVGENQRVPADVPEGVTVVRVYGYNAETITVDCTMLERVELVRIPVSPTLGRKAGCRVDVGVLNCTRHESVPGGVQVSRVTAFLVS